CTCQPRCEGIDHRSYDLADEYRHHRERPVNRDRGIVRVTLWPGDYLLAEFLPSKEVAVAHLASGICFSRAWSADKRADAPNIFLRDCACRFGWLERLASSCSACAFCRARPHDWDCGGMGNSVRPEHGIAGCDRKMVRSVHGTVERRR